MSLRLLGSIGVLTWTAIGAGAVYSYEQWLHKMRKGELVELNPLAELGQALKTFWYPMSPFVKENNPWVDLSDGFKFPNVDMRIPYSKPCHQRDLCTGLQDRWPPRPAATHPALDKCTPVQGVGGVARDAVHAVDPRKYILARLAYEPNYGVDETAIDRYLETGDVTWDLGRAPANVELVGGRSTVKPFSYEDFLHNVPNKDGSHGFKDYEHIDTDRARIAGPLLPFVAPTLTAGDHSPSELSTPMDNAQVAYAFGNSCADHHTRFKWADRDPDLPVNYKEPEALGWGHAHKVALPGDVLPEGDFYKFYALREWDQYNAANMSKYITDFLDTDRVEGSYEYDDRNCDMNIRKI